MRAAYASLPPTPPHSTSGNPAHLSPSYCSMEFVAEQALTTTILQKAQINHLSCPYMPDLVAINYHILCERPAGWVCAGRLCWLLQWVCGRWASCAVDAPPVLADLTLTRCLPSSPAPPPTARPRLCRARPRQERQPAGASARAWCGGGCRSCRAAADATTVTGAGHRRVQ